MRRRTASGDATTSWPSTLALPVVGGSSVARMRDSVVLPAPLGPSSPNTVPGRDREVEAVQGSHVAEVPAQLADFDGGVMPHSFGS